MGIAAALLLALAAVGFIVARPDPRTDLAGRPATGTPTTGAPPAEVPYLTFADPPGEVFRTDSHMSDPSLRRYVLADPANQDIRFEVVNIARSTFIGSEDVGSDDAEPTALRPTRSNPVEAAGRGESTVMFDEADLTWAVTGQDAAMGTDGGGGRSVDDTRLRRATLTFLSELRLDDGPPVAGTAYREIPVWEREYPVWSINTSDPEDQSNPSRTTMSAFHDTSTEIDELPGTRATVRGHRAAVGFLSVIWRETPETILILTGGSAPEELVRTAQELLDSDRDVYRSLPGIESDPSYTLGASSIVVTAPPDTADVTIRFLYTDADGTPIREPGVIGASRSPLETSGDFGSQGKFVIPKKELLTAPGAGGTPSVYIWAEQGRAEEVVSYDTALPACATKVDFPAPGSPPTQVELDPDCMTG